MKKKLLTKFWVVLGFTLLSSNMYSTHIVDGFSYILNHKERTATLERVEGSVKLEISQANIPSTVPVKVIDYGTDYYKVTEIGTSAFSRCNKLASVIIPEGVTKIEKNAFIDCAALSNIIIPASVTYIGYDAFAGTAWYENLPDGVVYINSMAYTYKGEMPENTAIAIKEGTEIIAPFAFSDYENLTSISLPASLKTINALAFSESKNLSEITLPANLEFIGAAAFDQTGLKTLTIPASVKYMGLGVHPKTIRFEGLTPPTTTPQFDMFIYHTKRTFLVPYKSFAAYCKTQLIPLGTDEYNSMNVKALEDSKDIYAVTSTIGDSDGWQDTAGKVFINGEEGLTGIKEGEKIEIKVSALEDFTLIDSIQINDEKPIKLENETTYTYTIESALAKSYSIKVNFKDKWTVSISHQTTDNIKIYALDGTVIIENIKESAPVTILTLTGQTLYQGTTDSYAPVSLTNGIYLVKAGNQTQKIVIK